MTLAATCFSFKIYESDVSTHAIANMYSAIDDAIANMYDAIINSGSPKMVVFKRLSVVHSPVVLGRQGKIN